MEAKRIISVVEFLDEIPMDANYLFTKVFDLPAQESPDAKINRIIAGDISDAVNTVSVNQHFYEVSSQQFDDLMKAGIYIKTPAEKYALLKEKYKI